MTVATFDLTFSEERVTDEFIKEIIPLTIRHWIEVGNKAIKFQPDWAMYSDAYARGVLRVYSARRTNELKGYAVFIIHNSSQYMGTIMATQDTLFLDKEERKGMVGVSFIRFCENALMGAGVHLIRQNVTFQRDFGPVLERMGYIPKEIVYERRIG